jgi:hypothetical protein
MKRVVTVLASFELFGDLSCSVMEYVNTSITLVIYCNNKRTIGIVTKATKQL